MATQFGVPFIDGDNLHSAQNKEWMASRGALSDAKRLPWLRSVGGSLASVAGPGVVVACSGLKRSYRELLREYAPPMFTVFPR